MSSVIVQSLWIGSSLGPMQHLSIRSFLKNGHDFHLYTYDRIAEVPEGTTICDAAAILPRESIFCYQHGFGRGSYSAFSNLFRYQLLFERGGWWVDSDVVCLRPFDFDDDFVFATEHDDGGAVSAASCVFKSPSRSAYLDYCIRACNAKNKDELRWKEIGPLLLAEAITRYDLTSHLVPVHVFNPVDWFDFAGMLAPGFDESRLTDSHAVHLWNQMWKSENLKPDTAAQPGSLYAFLRERYLASPPAA